MSTPKLAANEPTAAAQVACLQLLPFSEIKAMWRRLFDAETPTQNRKFLERRIAYKLQENEFCKVDPGLLDSNRKKIAMLIEKGKIKNRDRDYRPAAGTLLTREYQGKQHKVIATADGQYEFEGRAYGSLSMIAREITGSRWSGPVFFGLKDYAAKKGGRK